MPSSKDKKLSRIEAEIDKLRIKHKDSEKRKVAEDVFDYATLKTLYHLSNRGYIEALGGSISTGKEANVFHALGAGGREVAVKIYRVSSSNFNAIQEYIRGDPRFEKVGHRRRDIIVAWARKEFQNLKRAYDAGIRVPEPIVVERNVLLMEFIGEDGVGAPQLRSVSLGEGEAEQMFKVIVDYMKTLYCSLHMVHGDLSEYNVLVDSNRNPVLIDMGQGVLRAHPMAEEFLKRDVGNILRFFRKHGVKAAEEDILYRIRGEEMITS